MSKCSDINVGSIEEDIEILKNIIEVYESCSVPEIDMQVDITFGKKEVNAIKTILGNLEALCDMQMAADRELKNAKQINEEHQKINGELREKVTKLEEENRELMSEYHNRIQEKIDLEQDLKILEQKIKDKIEELRNEKEQLRIEKRVLWDSGIYKIDLKIEILQELLQESEDK